MAVINTVSIWIPLLHSRLPKLCGSTAPPHKILGRHVPPAPHPIPLHLLITIGMSGRKSRIAPLLHYFTDKLYLRRILECACNGPTVFPVILSLYILCDPVKILAYFMIVKMLKWMTEFVVL